MNAIKILQLSEADLKQILASEREKTFNLFLTAIQGSTSTNKESELMSRNETCSYFGISKPCLHDWTKRGILKSHRIGGRVFYKRSDIEALTEKRKS